LTVSDNLKVVTFLRHSVVCFCWSAKRLAIWSQKS